jgi:RHS repeat-associated protein
VGQPQAICTSSLTAATGSILVSTTLSQPNALVVQYQLERQLAPGSYSVVSGWTSNSAVLSQLPADTYRLWVRGASQDVVNPTAVCGLVSYPIRIDALTAFASSYSITPGVPVSLWVEGAPFNSGQALWTNQGLQFSPSAQPQNLTATFTWEGWVKPELPLSGNNFNERYVLYPHYNGSVYSDTYAGLGIAAGTDGIRLVGHTAYYLQQILDYRTSITDWTHVAVVFTNNVASLLINGVVKASNVVPPQGKIMYPSNYLTGVPWGEYGRYHGAVDEVRLWNTARTTAEVTRDYRRLLTGQEPGLLTYWAFESITNNTALAAGSLGVSATLGGPADGYGLVSGVNANTATQTGVVSWTARPGGQIYTGPSITVSPTQSTTYTVSRSDLACQVPVAITVGPRIPCSFSLVAVATPQSLSCGQPVSLSVATSGPVSATAGVIQYDWSELSSGGLSTTVGMGTSLTALPASATLSPGISTTYNSAAGISTVYTSGTGVATYSVTATQGLCAATASVSAVLTGAPSLTISSPKAIYSEGESLTLTAGVSATTAQPLSYTWTGPSSTGALQSGPQTFTVTSQTLTVPNATTAMSGAYTVSITTVGGCTATVGLSLTVTPNSFSCTCQDCDLPTVKDTDNPPVAASNRGSAGQNFVQESVYFNAGGSSVAQTITYFDGLGRTVQKVSVGTGGKTTAVPVADVVQPMVYDALGRQPIQYLPYAVGTNNGAYRSSAASSVSGYYAGLPDKTGNAFSTIQYEASPLNRVQLQIAPGSNTPVRISYRTNTAGELPLLTYDFATHNINVVGYAAGQLYVTETTDENSHKTIEYKDKEGRVVGKDIEGLKTLYAYDDFGWLRCVVPPKASANLGGGTNFDPFAGDLLFGYDYDERGRMVRKKVPGAGITTMTYDSLDRLLTSTDANGTTITTDYDGLNRVTATRQGGTILTQTFYDGYGYGEKGFDAAHAYNQPQLSSKQGMTTGTKTLVLGTGTYLTSSTYYDNLGRVIQTASDNHKGGVDRSSMKLDYVGRSLESKLTTANSSTAITIDTRTAYEAGGRIKSVCQQVSDNQQAQPGSVGAYWEPVARHSYNGIGELTKKTLGCGIQNIDYQHQMRGWLTRMNDPADLNKGFAPADKHFFGMKLAYDGVGNISQWDYRNGQVNYAPPYDLTQKPAYQYSFTYDNLNRIKTGNLTQQGQAVFSLDNLSYDANGNIQTLNRAMGSASDALTYSYGANTNRLGGVTDNSGSAAFAQSSSYSYDANGNLITDSGKGITGIDYNYLNLPKAIHKSSGDVTYIYSASGQKLRASFPASAGSPAKVYDYIGGLVYTNNKLEFIPTAEGRILPPGLASTTVAIGSSQTVVASNQFYRYEYHLKDHLGNLRAACRCGERAVATTPSDSYAPQVVQEQHYDPFGLDLPDLGVQPGVTASRFKYNGKEEQAGLGWLDYGARLYDPAVPRWLQVDPLTDEQEAWSPYHFTYDNPINYVDLLGLSPSNISENSNIAICPTCPKGTEYDKYRDSKSLYTYDKAMGIVVNGDGKGPTVYGKKTSYDYNGLIYGSGDALIYLGNNSISTRSKLDAANSTSGTSIASQYLRQTGWGQTRTPKWLFKTLPKRVGLPFKGMSAPLRASTLGGIAGRSVPLIGRGFVAVSAGLSIYNIATAENKTETVTVEAGGWAGAWAASTAAGSALTATGIDLTGPWGWTAHGVITIGAGVSGFYGGKEVGQAVYDKTKE